MTNYELPEFAKTGEVKEVKSERTPIKVKKSFCERHPRTCKAGKIAGKGAIIVGGTALVVAAAPEALIEAGMETAWAGGGKVKKKVDERRGKSVTKTVNKPVSQSVSAPSKKKSTSKTATRKKPVSKKVSTAKKKTTIKKPVTKKKTTRKPKSDGLDYWRI